MHDAESLEENEGLLEKDGPSAADSGEPVELRNLVSRPEDNESVTKLLQDDELDDPLDEPPEESATRHDLIWTAEKERRLVRKLDRLVMPLLIIAFFALQLDRGNIGNALTDFFLRDVDITQGQFNTGQQLIALGIVLWEIPSNFVLYRVGPSIWLSFQIITWGLVATVQSLQHGAPAFYLTRFLLGSCESGFIPASLYTISRFYKRDETSKRFSWFFIGNHFATAVSGFIAYGILQLRGVFGFAGWQWLFIVEGIFTISIGITFVLFFPRSVSDPTSLTGMRYFSKQEAEILHERVIRDDPSKAHKGENITKEEAWSTFTNWRLIPHIIATVAGLSPMSALMAYGPRFVGSWGFGRLRANAMMSIGPSIGLFLTIFWGFLADKVGYRGLVALAGIFIWWLFLFISRLLVDSSNGAARFGVLTVAAAFGGTWHPVNGSWMALNAPTAGERSITMAILIMSANSAGIIGSQLFQEGDAPLYVVGWTMIVVLVSFAFLAMMSANVQYWLLNRRFKKAGSPKRYQP